MNDYYTSIRTNDGLARSILKVIYSLESNKRNDFKKWMEKQSYAFEEQFKAAVYLYDHQHFNHNVYADVLEMNIFDLPFEEYSVFVQIYKNTVMQFASKAPDRIHNCGIIVGVLTNESRAVAEFWQTAKTSFEVSNDNVAYGLFKALHVLREDFKLDHKPLEKDTRKWYEMYESLMRVSGAFIGNEAIVNNQFRIVDGRLVQLLDPTLLKAVKRTVIPKAMEIIGEEPVVEGSKSVAFAEVVAEQ